jgi:hypothetical protein
MSWNSFVCLPVQVVSGGQNFRSKKYLACERVLDLHGTSQYLPAAMSQRVVNKVPPDSGTTVFYTKDDAKNLLRSEESDDDGSHPSVRVWRLLLMSLPLLTISAAPLILFLVRAYFVFSRTTFHRSV